MTPQDIREKIFEKAVFGGYDMGSVDDFMEEMASELETAQRESATLKAKMKVLVDKIEEYRASEDAMRMTLLSAQKLSSQIESEAARGRTRSWPRPRPPRPAALTGSRARPAARRPASRRRRSPSPVSWRTRAPSASASWTSSTEIPQPRPPPLRRRLWTPLSKA